MNLVKLSRMNLDLILFVENYFTQANFWSSEIVHVCEEDRAQHEKEIHFIKSGRENIREMYFWNACTTFCAEFDLVNRENRSAMPSIFALYLYTAKCQNILCVFLYVRVTQNFFEPGASRRPKTGTFQFDTSCAMYPKNRFTCTYLTFNGYWFGCFTTQFFYSYLKILKGKA